MEKYKETGIKLRVVWGKDFEKNIKDVIDFTHWFISDVGMSAARELDLDNDFDFIVKMKDLSDMLYTQLVGKAEEEALNDYTSH